jgi:hypothetical protein
MSGYYGDVIPIHEYAGKQYQPSNGTEGACFQEGWCCKCKRDNEMNGTCFEEGRDAGDGDWCPTLGESFHGDGTPEWVFGPDGWPTCKRFLPLDAPDIERDELTIDMFGDKP